MRFGLDSLGVTRLPAEDVVVRESMAGWITSVLTATAQDESYHVVLHIRKEERATSQANLLIRFS